MTVDFSLYSKKINNKPPLDEEFIPLAVPSGEGGDIYNQLNNLLERQHTFCMLCITI